MSNSRKILHLCHGLYGGTNGLDTYIRNFVESSNDNNFIVVPTGQNKSCLKNVIEVEDLAELPGIVENLQIDIMFIHWTGQESFDDPDNNDLVKYGDKLISMSGRKFDQVFSGNSSPNSFVDTAFLWSEKKHKIVIISHTTYKLPTYLTNAVVDAVVHVSYEAFKINRRLQNQHFVIYPGLEKRFCNTPEISHSPKVRIGWLGRLNKYNGLAYQFIKENYSTRSDVEFIFAGQGSLDDNPPENFIFTGNISPEEFFRQIDIFLYPTSIDSFSLSLLEALSQGKPAIVSDIVEELADIGGAWVYKSNNQMKTYLDCFIRFKHVREYLGQENRKKVLNFSPEIMMENFESLIGYLINQTDIVF